MSQLDTLTFDATDLPKLFLGGGNDYIGTTDDNGFQYIITEPCSAEVPTHMVQRARIIRLDSFGIPCGVYEDLEHNLSTKHCVEVIQLIHERNFRHLVRLIGRTQCRNLGFSV